MQQKKPPSTLLPMGAIRKEFGKSEVPLTPRIHKCKSDAKKKPPLTSPKLANGDKKVLQGIRPGEIFEAAAEALGIPMLL